MKTIIQILAEHNDAIKDTSLFIQDRLGIRLCQFLTKNRERKPTIFRGGLASIVLT